MLRLPLLLTLFGGSAALRGTVGVVPVLVATLINKEGSQGGKIPFPPVELDVQLDFEVSRSEPQHQVRKAVKKKVPKKVKKQVVKKVVKKKVQKAKPVARALPPPPPPPPKKVVVQKVQQPKKPTKSLSEQLGEFKERVASASARVSKHKYAGVVWATLLFVWTPLAIIWVCNTLFGKEFLIDILVNVLPEQVPASYIEMAIDDGLWVGIFGACFVATIGTFVVESTSLAVDIVRGMLQAPPAKVEAGEKKKEGRFFGI